MSSIVIIGLIIIGVAFAIGKMVSAIHAPKVEAEHTAQEIEETRRKQEQSKQQSQRQDTRVVIIDKRLSFRERMAKWRAEKRGR